MPNVFSPNGDQVNDYFRPIEDISYCLGQDAELAIYNRWGTLVFHTNQVMVGWDGMINGSISAEGVYYYVFSVSDESQNLQQISGSFYISR